MKRVPFLVAFLVVISIAATAGFRSSSDKKARQLVGRWEMVSGDYDGHSTRNPDFVSVKVISAHHFLYLEYNKKTAKLQGVGSGSYTFDGDTYSEHIEFTERPESPDANTLIGTNVSFHVKVDGDTLTQTGKLLGRDLKEVYKRAD